MSGIVQVIVFILVITFIIPPIFNFFDISVDTYGIFVLWIIALAIFYFVLTRSSDG